MIPSRAHLHRALTQAQVQMQGLGASTQCAGAGELTQRARALTQHARALTQHAGSEALMQRAGAST